jgi:hypothetical protein
VDWRFGGVAVRHRVRKRHGRKQQSAVERARQLGRPDVGYSALRTA